MNKKELEIFKNNLEKYKTTLRTLERRTDEAERWREISLRTMTSCTGPKDFTEVRTNSIFLEQECEKLAATANLERNNLLLRFSALPTRDRELLESVYINNKTAQQVAGEFACTKRTILRNTTIAVINLYEIEKKKNFF